MLTVSRCARVPSTRAYAVVWDLRSPSTPPVRVPIGRTPPGAGAQPGRPDLYTSLPLTAYEVAIGRADLAPRGGRTTTVTLDMNAEGTLLALEVYSDYGTDRTRSWWTPATGDTVATLRGHQDVVSDIRFSPDGTLVGSTSIDGELIVWDTATGRPLERWRHLRSVGRRLQPGQRPGLRRRRRRLDAAHLGPVHGGHLSAADDPGRRRRAVRGRPTSRRTGSRWPIAGSTTQARDGSGSSTPPPENATLRPASRCRTPYVLAWRLASRRRAVRRVLVRRRVRAEDTGIVTVLDSATGKLLRKPRTSSTATATSGRWRTSTRVAACSWATRTHDHHRRRRDPSTPGRAVRPLRVLLRHPDRGREHRDGLRELPGRRCLSTGG